MSEKFAVYIPGSGFHPRATLAEANWLAGDELWKFRMGTRGGVWPENISRLGVYRWLSPYVVNRDGYEIEPEGFELTGRYVPLRLVSEKPGAQLDRWPCPDACEAYRDKCETCEGSGYVDQFGEAWAADPDVESVMDYEFEPVQEAPSIDPAWYDRGGMGWVLAWQIVAGLVLLGIGGAFYILTHLPPPAG